MKNTKIQGRKESLILRELTLILTQELDNDALRAVTINEVRLVNDNEVARVFYTFLSLSGENLTEEKIAHQLEDNKKKIRKMLASKLNMRYVPDLDFVYDTSLDNANKIESILREVNKK